MNLFSLAAFFTAALVGTSDAAFRPGRVATLQAIPDNFQQQMLEAVNVERAKLNYSALCINSKLQKASQLHSVDQATNNFMSHTGANGTTMTSRANAQGFKWNGLAENVAAGQSSVAAVMNAWMQSSGHRANILNKNYKFFGTGYAYTAGSRYKHHWTQNFATSQTEKCDDVASDALLVPASTTVPLTPAPTMVAPTPAPTTLPPTTLAPTPAPTTPAPTEVQKTDGPTPALTTVTPAPTVTTPTPTATTSAPREVVSIQKRMLDAVNAERAKEGKAPLCTNAKLQKAAQLHSEDQAAKNFMSHTGSNGSTMTSRVNAQVFKWNGLGENVAAGQVDVAAVMKSWMNSSGHRANIMGNFKFFGMGYAFNAGSTYKHYWTQSFALSSSEACDP